MSVVALGALSVGAGLGAGYLWLVVLSRRVRALNRRLDLHACRERVPVDAILRRERPERPMLPVRTRLRAEPQTAPMPAPRAGRSESEEEYW